MYKRDGSGGGSDFMCSAQIDKLLAIWYQKEDAHLTVKRSLTKERTQGGSYNLESYMIFVEKNVQLLHCCPIKWIGFWLEILCYFLSFSLNKANLPSGNSCS